MNLTTVANPDILVTIGVTAAYFVIAIVASTGLFLILEAAGLFDRNESDDEGMER